MFPRPVCACMSVRAHVSVGKGRLCACWGTEGHLQCMQVESELCVCIKPCGFMMESTHIKKLILNSKLIIKNWLESQKSLESLEISDNFVSCGASVQFYSWYQHVQQRDGLRSEPLFSELSTAFPVIIWTSPPWLRLYFIFISSGLVSSAVGDPLSGQDRRLERQTFGLSLRPHALGRVLAGKRPMATPFCPSLLSQPGGFSLPPGCGLSFPLLAFVCAVPSTRNTLSSPALPLRTLHPAWGISPPHNWHPPDPLAPTAASLLSPLRPSVQTTLVCTDKLYSVF